MEKLVLLTGVLALTAFSFIPAKEISSRKSAVINSPMEKEELKIIPASGSVPALKLKSSVKKNARKQIKPVVIIVDTVPVPLKLSTAEELKFTSINRSITNDGVEKKETTIATDQHGKKYQYSKHNDKITSLNIDGKEIPEAEYGNYSSLLDKIGNYNSERKKQFSIEKMQERKAELREKTERRNEEIRERKAEEIQERKQMTLQKNADVKERQLTLRKTLEIKDRQKENDFLRRNKKRESDIRALESQKRSIEFKLQRMKDKMKKDNGKETTDNETGDKQDEPTYSAKANNLVLNKMQDVKTKVEFKMAEKFEELKKFEYKATPLKYNTENNPQKLPAKPSPQKPAPPPTPLPGKP